MSLVLLTSALALLAAPHFARSWGRCLEPRDFTRLSVAALIGGVVALEGALGIIGAPTLLKAVGGSELARACRRIIGELAPGGSTVGWTALILATVFPVALLIAWRRATRASALMHVEPWLGYHAATGADALVVLPTDAPLAYSLSRPSPQIVISDGLLNTLAPDEMEAVIRHEQAHLRHRHPPLLVAIDALDRVLPLVRPSTNAVRTAVERWADEEAAGPGPRERTAVHDALLHVATTLTDEPALAAFTSVATLLDRLDALESAPPSPRRGQRLSAHLAIGGIGAVGAMALAGWLTEAHIVPAIAGICHM